MYADSLAPDRGAPGFRNRGPGGKPNERYSRQIDELDYIVPRGGYYFEHDDRDVWNPKRGNQQQGGADCRPPPMRNPDNRGPPNGNRRSSYHNMPYQQHGNGTSRGRDREQHHGRAPVMSRIGGPSSRALPPSPPAERPLPHRERERERERSPVGRSELRAGHNHRAERRRPEEAAPARPRTTIRSQVHYQGKVGSAPAVAATFEAPEADDEPPRGRHSDVRTRHSSPEHDSRAKAAPDQRQGSEARLDRGREPGGALGRFAGRITSQVVGFERLQQRDQPPPAHHQRSGDDDVTRAGNGVFQRLGGTAPSQHRPMGGMRADARGKWGHDLFETVNAEPDEKPSLLRKSLLF